jgi:hypothetical protein
VQYPGRWAFVRVGTRPRGCDEEAVQDDQGRDGEEEERAHGWRLGVVLGGSSTCEFALVRARRSRVHRPQQRYEGRQHGPPSGSTPGVELGLEEFFEAV